MGIKGFMSYLKDRNISAQEETLHPNTTTLLIDGNGWMFALFDETMSKVNGGGYSLFRKVIVREVKYLRDSLGFHVVVYFDGPDSQLKAGTREARRQQREERWLALCDLISRQADIDASTRISYATTQSQSSLQTDQRDLPLPLLVSEQLKQTLCALKVKVITCSGEADQQLALACSAINTSSPPSATKASPGMAVVYADDSDFILMQNVPYIRFPPPFQSCFSTLSHCNSSKEVVAKVWRRSHVATSLELTEKQLVEFVVAVGNDFTSPFNRKLFANLVVKDVSTLGHDVEALELLRQYFISQGTGFFLYSLTPEVNQAIDYSRALYGLQDLSKFPLDPPPDQSTSSGGIELSSLSLALQARLEGYLKTATGKGRGRSKGSKPQLQDAHMLGKLAVGFLHSLLLYPLPTAAAPAPATSTAGLYVVDLTASLQLGHLQALADMLTTLESRTKKESHRGDHCNSDDGDSNIEKMEEDENVWKAVKAVEVKVPSSLPGFFSAHLFQLVCKQLLRQCRRESATTTAASLAPWHEPCVLFDAALYYDLLVGKKNGRSEEALCSAQQSVESFLRSAALSPQTQDLASSSSIPSSSAASSAAAAINNASSKSGGKALLSMLQMGSSQKALSTGKARGAGTVSSITVSTLDPNVNQFESRLISPAPMKKKEDVLPIDAYRDEILFRIARDPVTIIFGETGCGKSSRLPIMLLRHAEETHQKCRMMVSQPRRIAVSSLFKRVRETLGDKVGMRMGHGVREESSDTQIFFVTTGYLVRLLAHKPDAMRNHTHIIIDEVHERSVDGDVVCLLVRRLLARFPHIKVILMSATIHTDLYRTYFSVGEGEEDQRWEATNPDKQASILEEPEPEDGSRDMRHCLFVGSRRFPLDIRYLETLGEYTQGRPEVCLAANRLIQACSGGKSSRGAGGRRGEGLADLKNIHNSTVGSLQFIKDQHTLTLQLISQVGSLGSSLLVFVSGMSDIIELTEKLGHASAKYHVIAIHSEIPFEEQEAAFMPTMSHEVKIILATNAAESSITLPDVDIIICLGMHKAISYNLERHHSVLSNQWISKASSTQRAGRTGRVRPGRVFRLYTLSLFRDVMSEHGEPEILRVPLQETILNLRVMLESSEDFEGVVPLLEDMLEPPDVRNVEQSFEYLHSVGMIDAPNDEGVLTPTGNFVGSLPVGIMLGRLVAFSVLLGVEAEGITLAAALSLPKSPFRIASPLVHKDPAEYNAIVQRIFLGASTFDSGVYSEPLMLMNLLRAWRALPEGGGRKDRWAAKYGIVKSRLRYFDSVGKNLQQQVSKILISHGHIRGGNTMSHEKNKQQQKFSTSPGADTGAGATSRHSCSPEVYNTLRLILLWVNANSNLLKLSRVTKLPKNTRQLTLSGDTLLTPHQLQSLFPPAAVPFNVTTTNENMCVFHIASSDYLAQHRSPTRLCDILLEMLTIAVTNEYSLIPVVWLKVEELDENDDNSSLSSISMGKSKDENKKKNKKKNNAYDGKTARVSYMIALASTLSEETYDTILAAAKENITSKIESYSCHQLRGVEEGGGGEADETYFRVFRVELFSMPVSSKPSPLDKLLNANFSTFHMKLSFVNKIKAIYKNCQIPVSMLHQMIYHLTPGDVIIEQTQIASPSQCLEFLPEPQPQEPDDNMDAPLPSSAVEGGQEQVWSAHSGERGGLVEDVALGIRLYRAYLSGLSKGKGTVLVRTPASSAPASAPSSVVGSAAWAQTKITSENEQQQQQVSALFPSTPVMVNSCPASSWKNVLSSWKDSKQAFLERYSVPGSMVYTGSLDLFAVAGNTLDLGGAVRCEGVTVLPPGGSWLSLALLCLNIEPLNYFTPAGAQQITEEGHMTDERMALVEEARELLLQHGEGEGGAGGRVQRNQALIDALSEIFSPWTQNVVGDEDSEFEIIKIEDLYYYQCPQCQVRFADVTSCKKHIKKTGHVRQLKGKKSVKEKKKKGEMLLAAEKKKSGSGGTGKNMPTSCGIQQIDRTPTSPSVSTHPTPAVVCDVGSYGMVVPRKKSREFVCTLLPLCSSSFKKRSFATAEGLQRHMEVKHPNMGTDTGSPGTGTGAGAGSQQHRQLRGHADSMGVITEVMSRVSLADHQQKGKNQGQDGVTSLSCPLCGHKKKRFKSKESLQDHMSQKHDIRCPSDGAADVASSIDVAADCIATASVKGGLHNIATTASIVPPFLLPSSGVHRCDRCVHTEFGSLALLNAHMKEQHDVDALGAMLDSFFDSDEERRSC